MVGCKAEIIKVLGDCDDRRVGRDVLEAGKVRFNELPQDRDGVRGLLV